MPITARFDSVGPLARNVADIALVDQVLRPDSAPIAPTLLRGVRLGKPASYWEGLDPEVERVATDALLRLHGAGIEVIEVDVPDMVRSDLQTVMDILSFEVVANETRFCGNRASVSILNNSMRK